MAGKGKLKATSWSCTWPKMRSPVQGTIIWGSPVMWGAMARSAQSMRPRNSLARVPPRFQSQAWPRRMIWAPLP